MKNIDTYLCKALDMYPWRLEDSIESIQYALSYNDKNPHTLLLAGRFYAEELCDYKEAIRYYEEAMASDLDAIKVYPYLIDAYLTMEETEKAKKLIEFALTKNGVDKSLIVTKKIRLFEMDGKFKKATKLIDLLKLEMYDSNWKSWIEETEARLKSKATISKKWKKKLAIKKGNLVVLRA